MNSLPLYYIAHSMGTTSMMVLISEDAKFVNENVAGIVFLATSGFFGRTRFFIRAFAPLSTTTDPKVIYYLY